MAVTEKTIEIERPVSTVYNQWTQFESFPMFMEGVKEVRQLEDERLFWRADIAGADREWYAVITGQVPDQQISWESTSGARNGGTVRFEPVAADRTRVHLQLDFEPEGAVETIGDKLGFVSRRAQGDLERFKDFVEHQGAESGAWRGTIHGGEVTRDDRGEPGGPVGLV